MEKSSASNKTRRFLSKIKKISKEKGIRYVVIAGIRKVRKQLIISFEYNYYKLFKSRNIFMFQRKPYKYFYHEYNTTWRNERAVEIPIVWNIVKACGRINVLEVGNVLSHYFGVNHDIVDKYEKAEGVITEDVTELCSSKKYDLIISISTLEHVGWDENPSDHRILHEPEKIIRAIENLKGLLTTNGKIVVTLPLGYNADLDRLLKNDKIRFDSRFCLKRVSKDNKWVETIWKDVEDSKYNSPFPAANGLIIGVIKT